MTAHNRIDRTLFCFDESGKAAGAICVDYVALLKDENEKAFESYEV